MAAATAAPTKPSSSLANALIDRLVALAEAPSTDSLRLSASSAGTAPTREASLSFGATSAGNGGWSEQLAEQEQTLNHLLPLLSRAAHWHPATIARLLAALEKALDRPAGQRTLAQRNSLTNLYSSPNKEKANFVSSVTSKVSTAVSSAGSAVTSIRSVDENKAMK